MFRNHYISPLTLLICGLVAMAVLIACGSTDGGDTDSAEQGFQQVMDI